jgi:pyruvate/2-oxoglutarate dehydrogenase complex dihydrolipoamide acyltransferase (E2) component
MDTAAVGVTEKEDEEQRMHEQDVFDRVVFFLAALTVGLFSRVLGADDAPFRPVMGKRGESDAATGAATTGAGSSASEPTREAASASATPSRCVRASRERAGASPRARNAASRAGKRTWIH